MRNFGTSWNWYRASANFTSALISTVLAVFLLASCVSGIKKSQQNCTSPLIVGHRGAPGYTPEHTLNSYRLAIEMGADYIEPDLVSTKDGVLVARHENEISETTDVAQRYPKRKTTKMIDGQITNGWFVEDFTIKEIKTLKAKERLPYRSQKDNGRFEVPTFEEIVRFVKEEGLKRGRKIGMAPEIKHSTYFQSIGLPMEDRFIKIIEENGLNTKDSMVMVQSFEVDNLKYLRKKLQFEVVQLYEQEYKRKINFLEVASYADWISPHKSFILRSDFVAKAHAAGLKVMPYTFRSDKENLPPEYKGQYRDEYLEYMRKGIDGLFTDFSDHAIAAREEYRASCR